MQLSRTFHQLHLQKNEQLVEAEPRDEPVPATPVGEGLRTPGGTMRRKRPRTRQLQRGFWQQVDNANTKEAMDNAKEWLVERGGTDWQLIPLEEELGKMWASQESANADVLLIFCAANARKLRKCQPFASPAEATLRKSLLLLGNEVHV